MKRSISVRKSCLWIGPPSGFSARIAERFALIGALLLSSLAYPIQSAGAAVVPVRLPENIFNLSNILTLPVHIDNPVAAAAADLALDAGVTVQIQPPEAVNDGATWTLDNGSELASGAMQPGISPGSHSVQFKSLLNWQSPSTVTFLAVGGKTVSISATYRVRAAFYFRDIPEQTARVGSALEFLVRAQDGSDPNSPPAGTQLTMSVAPTPAGPVTFDPATGLFRFTPDAADRLPFVVTFSVPGGGLPGAVTLTPGNALAPEESVIIYQRPLPDPESRDFITITETPTGTNVFNDTFRPTTAVDISGETLVFADGHPAHLYNTFNGRLDLSALNLYADRIIIRSPLKLAQTQVSIHARELRFEGAGSLDTTPAARSLLPPGVTLDDGLLRGNDGDPGHAAGSVNVFVEQFHSDETTTPRFILHGGDGGPAGEGRDGMVNEDWRVDGNGVPLYSFSTPAWFGLMSHLGIAICGFTLNGGAAVFLEEFESGHKTGSCGVKSPPLAEAGIPAGHPGDAGNGGSIQSTLDLSSVANLSGGIAGSKGADHVGGTLGSPFYYVTESTTINPKTHEDTTKETKTMIHAAQGRPAPAPNANRPVGIIGNVTVVTNTGTWLHSYAVRPILAYAKECYLQGHIPETRQLLTDYYQLLIANTPVVDDPSALSDEAFREKINLDQLALETEALLHRIDSNLDYFGNPAGWVPMLSFEANFLAFQDEIEKSVPILYLSYWLQHAATNVENSVSAATTAKATLEAELAQLETAINQAQEAIPRLQVQADAINRQIADVRTALTNKLNELEARAQQNVEDRNKVPFWKKALGTLSVVAELVPVGQPVLGEVGAGLGLLSKIDPNKPLESAEALAPKAFDIFKQQNITVCFGNGSTNKPPITGTNHVAGTNSNTSTNKTVKDKLSGLASCGKFLGDELKQLADVFKETKVDAKDVAAELAKLEAADPEFNALIAQITDLNAQKEKFAQDLAAALQAVATITSSMAENVIGTQELVDRIEGGFNALDQGALLHIQVMERRAKDRLLEYEYLMAQSFQYRRLRPFTDDLQLNRLFDRFEVLVEAGNSHILSDADFTTLKSLYVDALRAIIHNSFDNDNAPGVSNPITFRLTTNQLQQLNQQGRITVNLKELGLISPQQEDVRIADLKTLRMPVHAIGGQPNTHALLRVNYEHSGVSRLKSGGNTYLFRHYNADTVNPIVWNTVYDGLSGDLVNATLSPDDRSLISVLLNLDSRSSQDLQFFSLPGAWADIIITKEVLADNGADFGIDDLVVQVKFLFRNTSATLRELTVETADNLSPVITVSQTDINGRQDGIGRFTRVFAQSSAVSLEAPSTYGRFQFDGWTVNELPLTNRSPILPLVLATSSRVQARFVLAPSGQQGGLQIVALPGAPGQMGFKFSTLSGRKYTIETTPQLIHPIWTPVDTRTGDGNQAVFTRPMGQNGTGFFRVRLDP